MIVINTIEAVVGFRRSPLKDHGASNPGTASVAVTVDAVVTVTEDNKRKKSKQK